jgi:hypothetical protein
MTTVVPTSNFPILRFSSFRKRGDCSIGRGGRPPGCRALRLAEHQIIAASRRNSQASRLRSKEKRCTAKAFRPHNERKTLRMLSI